MKAESAPVPGSPDSVAKVPLVNIANGLTMLRILLVPAVAFTLSYQHGTSIKLRLVAAALFTLAALTDHWDGHLARTRGLITDFGKIADPIADKALMLVTLAVLSAMNELTWWVTGIIAVRELGITLLRLAVIHLAVIPASLGGKIKTLVQIIAIGLYVLPLGWVWATAVAQVIMTAAVALTVATGVEYVYQVVGIISAAKAAGAKVTNGVQQ